MGTIYEFSCSDCGFGVGVSGGEDRGFESATKTVQCTECKNLGDLTIPLVESESQDYGIPEYKPVNLARPLFPGLIVLIIALILVQMGYGTTIIKGLGVWLVFGLFLSVLIIGAAIVANFVERRRYEKEAQAAERRPDCSPSLNTYHCTAVGHQLVDWPPKPDDYPCPKCNNQMTQGVVLENWD